MELILWRHAEAEEATVGQSDRKRELTKRGKNQARRIAGWLGEHRPKDLRILVSPAERCRQTASALGLPYETDPRLDTTAEVADLLDAAQWPTDLGKSGGAVLLVGHQPTLGRLAAWLLSGAEADWNIRKGAVWWFSSGPQPSDGLIVLKAAIGPDLL
ncbi:MAG: histidine phosphatase family protein [Sterolibacterium sp.]|jgi:phosphohistidine phosphatase